MWVRALFDAVSARSSGTPCRQSRYPRQARPLVESLEDRTLLTDHGVHTFTGLVLRKRGNQTITITDTHNSTLKGNVLVDVL